jgi:ABC-2 type transport system ATP-binding protein
VKDIDLERAADQLRSGEKDAARERLTLYLKEHPQSDVGWYLISFAVDVRSHQLEALERCLLLNPANKLAQTRQKLLLASGSRDGSIGTSPSDGKPLSERSAARQAGVLARVRSGQRSARQPQTTIEVEDLRRAYRVKTGVFRRTAKEVIAVDGISFQVDSGELFGLLGPNGAGKTTTVKMLTTLLLPTGGTARVAGFDILRQAQEIRRRIGFIFGGERGLYWRLSGYDNLRYFASLYQVEPRLAKKRIPQLLELVGLEERADEKVEGYSRGMKQRLHVARTLLHDPSLLFLDEPTIGLDPVGARKLRQVIRNLQAERKTILLTTHYMFEADALCDRIGVIDHGRIVALDTPEGLKRHVSDLSVIDIEVFGVHQDILKRIRDKSFVDTVSVEDRDQRQSLRVQTALGSEAVPELMAELSSLRVGRVQVREPTLEDAYVRLVGGTESPQE